MSFVKVDDIKGREIVPGFTGRFIHSDHMTVAYWDIKAGAVIPPHEHVHEMIVNVIRGQLELNIGNEAQVLAPGLVGVIPGRVSHSARAITDCFVIDVFHPVREEYR